MGSIVHCSVLDGVTCFPSLKVRIRTMPRLPARNGALKVFNSSMVSQRAWIGWGMRQFLGWGKPQRMGTILRRCSVSSQMMMLTGPITLCVLVLLLFFVSFFFVFCVVFFFF